MIRILPPPYPIPTAKLAVVQPAPGRVFLKMRGGNLAQQVLMELSISEARAFAGEFLMALAVADQHNRPEPGPQAPKLPPLHPLFRPGAGLEPA